MKSVYHATCLGVLLLINSVFAGESKDPWTVEAKDGMPQSIRKVVKGVEVMWLLRKDQVSCDKLYINGELCFEPAEDEQVLLSASALDAEAGSLGFPVLKMVPAVAMKYDRLEVFVRDPAGKKWSRRTLFPQAKLPGEVDDITAFGSLSAALDRVLLRVVRFSGADETEFTDEAWETWELSTGRWLSTGLAIAGERDGKRS